MERYEDPLLAEKVILIGQLLFSILAEKYLFGSVSNIPESRL